MPPWPLHSCTGTIRGRGPPVLALYVVQLLQPGWTCKPADDVFIWRGHRVFRLLGFPFRTRAMKSSSADMDITWYYCGCAHPNLTVPSIRLPTHIFVAHSGEPKSWSSLRADPSAARSIAWKEGPSDSHPASPASKADCACVRVRSTPSRYPDPKLELSDSTPKYIRTQKPEFSSDSSGNIFWYQIIWNTSNLRSFSFVHADHFVHFLTKPWQVKKNEGSYWIT